MSIGPMTSGEVLAVARLRQWAYDKSAVKHGKVQNLRSPGRAPKHATTNRYDAVLVRLIDFDRAMASLDSQEQVALILHYRDHETEARIATTLQCSVRKVAYLLPTARKHLANVLDRMDLL